MKEGSVDDSWWKERKKRKKKKKEGLSPYLYCAMKDFEQVDTYVNE